MSVKQIAKDGGKTGLCEGSDKGKRWRGRRRSCRGGKKVLDRASVDKIFAVLYNEKAKNGVLWFLRRGLSCVIVVRAQACGKRNSLWAES